MSGVYDLRNFMDGMYDDNFYFNIPLTTSRTLVIPGSTRQIASCDIHLSTGTGRGRTAATYRLSEVLSSKAFAIR